MAVALREEIAEKDCRRVRIFVLFRTVAAWLPLAREFFQNSVPSWTGPIQDRPNCNCKSISLGSQEDLTKEQAKARLAEMISEVGG